MVKRRRHPKHESVPQRPPVKRKILAKTPADRVCDKCTETHPECMDSPEQICVFKIRKKIYCRFEKQQVGSCFYGDTCWFSHTPALNTG